MRIAVALTFLLGACAPSPYGLPQGDECELNSECDAPLVCRIGYCRRECSTSRDCAAGLDCLLDNDGLGACQLPAETRCTTNSECPSSLVCTMGECTNECNCADATEACEDCPPGALCTMRDDGSRGCFDPSNRTCVYASDCAADESSFVCASDGRCRIECRSDCDCRFGDVCREQMFVKDRGGEPTMVTGYLCVIPEPPDASSCLPGGAP